MNKWISIMMAGTVALGGAVAFADDDDGEEAEQTGFGLAGLLSKDNKEELPDVTISVGEPLSDAPWKLKSGKYYKVAMVSDGTGEIAITGPEFFRAVWVNEVVINDLETRPFGISSFEFDDAGTIELSFVAIKPGSYEIYVPGARGDSQKIAVTIE